MKLKIKWFLLFFALLISNGVLATDNPDPLEPINRVIFKFNDGIDTVFIRPIAILYNKIIPKPLATGIYNIYRNIDTVPIVLNDLLQLNFHQATSDAWRLGINSTVGIGGFFDVASQMGLEYNYEDFGLTMARWGYTKSMYIQLPLFGPGTVRDTMGYLVDYYYLSIYPYIEPQRTRLGIYFFGVLVRRADLLRYEDFMQEAALDKYVFIRDAYFQHRNYLIEHNKQMCNPDFSKNKIEETAS